jgi:hypothetical protein
MLEEIFDRTKRIETRTTKLSNHFGVETGATRSRFEDGKLHVTSRKVSLDELMSLVPADHKRDIVDIYCGDDLLATFTVER